MFEHKFCKGAKTVKDYIKLYDGNVKLLAVDGDNKITTVQRRNWKKYENDTLFDNIQNPFSYEELIYVCKKL